MSNRISVVTVILAVEFANFKVAVVLSSDSFQRVLGRGAKIEFIPLVGVFCLDYCLGLLQCFLNFKMLPLSSILLRDSSDTHQYKFPNQKFY